MELVVDPIRAQIYFEVLVRGEVTAHKLMQVLPINRSTLTHHLTKFVEAGIFIVDIPATGRPVKYYRLNEVFEETIIVEGISSHSVKERIMFLESTATHLHVVADLARRLASQLKEHSKPLSQIGFIFNLMTREEVDIWNKHYTKFMENVSEEIKKKKLELKKNKECTHVAFSGFLPIINTES